MNYAEFEAKFNEEAKTEEGAVKMYIIAAIEYIEGNNEAKKMVSLTLPKPSLNSAGMPGSSEQYRLDHMKEDINIPRSYIGGTHANGYSDFSLDYTITSLPQSKKGEKESKIFIQSGGKDNPTPVNLKKNKFGIWKIFNISSVATGVKRIEDDDF